MTTRVVFVQPYLAAYRVSFYRRLSSVLAEDGMRVEVVVGHRDSTRADSGDWPVTEWPDPLGGWTGDRVRWRRGAFDTHDLVIMEQAIRNIEAWTLGSRSRRARPGLALWGHGGSADGTGMLKRRAKAWITSRADWFFAYTQGAADHVVADGFPSTRVTVVGNTFDTASLRAAIAAVTDRELDDFRRRNRVAPGQTALFIGGVDEAKDIEFLLASAAAAADLLEGFTLLVAGAGDLLDDVRRAQEAGGPVRALGRVDGSDKAVALRAADLLMIPRGVGLVAIDSLVAGLPIVTVDGRGHGPEVEYLTDRQRLALPESTDAHSFGIHVADLLQSPRTLIDMSRSCRDAADMHTMDGMVEAFREGLLALRDIHEHGL